MRAIFILLLMRIITCLLHNFKPGIGSVNHYNEKYHCSKEILDTSYEFILFQGLMDHSSAR